MPRQVLFALLIEAVLVGLSTVLLVQPKMMFEGQTSTFKSVAKGSGFVILCLTFCWSVFLGAILALNAISIRI